MRVSFVVLLDVVLIGGEDECTRALEVDHHDDETGRVAGRVKQVQPGEELEPRVVKGRPREVEVEVVRQVDALVHLGRDRPERMLELFLVHVDRDVLSSLEVRVQAARVVEVQV